MTPLLEVSDLQIDFFSQQGHVKAVRGVSFVMHPGDTLALVGESGSGKSVTSQALLGVIDPPGRLVGGDVCWKGRSLFRGADAQRYARSIRGKEVAMVVQDPMSSLDPLLRAGSQVVEVLRVHMGLSRRAATARAVELLDLVGIPSPHKRMRQYPWELSGGMQQRVLIAMALACEPQLLVADEPTTALDVTIQAEILGLLGRLQEDLGLAILLVTHDLGVVAEFCDRLAVMYAGKVLETGLAADVYRQPGSPYTEGLLRAMPRLDVPTRRLDAIDGQPPDLRTPPTGCPFHPRCPFASDRCETEMPPLTERMGRWVACWHARHERAVS